MNILILDNSALISRNKDFCVEIGTGKFAKELKDLGNEVTFYGQMLYNIENTTDVYPLLANGIKVVGSPRLKNKLFSYLRLYSKAIPYILKADYIYMYYPTALKFLLFFAIIFRKKFGLYIRGIDDLKNRESIFFYKHASRVFTVADFFTNYVNQTSCNNIASTIRPMIIFNEKDINFHRSYKTHTHLLKILYLGRMTNDKGIIELLHAVKVLVDRGIAVELKLVGSGEYLTELQKLSEDLNISQYTEFVGSVFNKDDIKKYYESSDVYVLPTYHEGFPRTLYEAMITGTPILTTFVGGISGIMKNNVNCLELQPKSVESIVKGLIFANENYEKMIILAKNAQNTIRNILETRKDTHAKSLDKFLKH